MTEPVKLMTVAECRERLPFKISTRTWRGDEVRRPNSKARRVWLDLRVKLYRSKVSPFFAMQPHWRSLIFRQPAFTAKHILDAFWWLRLDLTDDVQGNPPIV